MTKTALSSSGLLPNVRPRVLTLSVRLGEHREQTVVATPTHYCGAVLTVEQLLELGVALPATAGCCCTLKADTMLAIS